MGNSLIVAPGRLACLPSQEQLSRFDSKQYDIHPGKEYVTIPGMNELTNQIERLQRRVEKTMVRL